MIERNYATWLARKNGLPADQIEDLMQESALADLQGIDCKSAARRLAQHLSSRLTNGIGFDVEASQPIDVEAELSALLPADELAFGIAVMSGELSRHNGTVSRRFQKIVETARSNSTESIASMV